MLAIRITAPRQGEVCDLPDPVAGPDEVLLRTAFIGLCGSDLGTWRGINPLVSYPRIPGHEIAGTIAGIGTRVSGWGVGDQALVIPYSACGACSACRAGRTNCCRNNQTLGVQREGGLGSLLAVPAAKLMRFPDLDLRTLALVEPLSVGFHAAARGRVVAGETVVVIGCGAVGVGAVAGAAARGARVVVVDVDERKLALARRLGAAETVDGRAVQLTGFLQALDGGEGPPVVIEAAGQPASFRAAVDAVAFAGRVVYIGYAKEPVAYETRRIVQKELDILGSRNATPADFQAAAAWLAEDRQRAAALISGVVPLSGALEALRHWDSAPGEVTKILIDSQGKANSPSG